MPSDKKPEGLETDQDEWITVGGKKIRIPKGEDGEEKVREQLPSASGQKQSNTKEAQKSYTQRFGVSRTLFKIRDEIVFKEYAKEGVISGFAGDNITIMSGGRVYKSDKDHTFLKSELLGEYHWDSMTRPDRVSLLEKAKIPSTYSTTDWSNLAKELRIALKENAPQGMTTATTGVHTPIYNPINEEKPVSQRIEEEMERQHKEKGGTDEEKGKD